MTVKFQISHGSQNGCVFRNTFTDQFGGDTAAFIIVLAHKAEPSAFRKIGIKGDHGNILAAKVGDFLTNQGIIDGTDRKSLHLLIQKILQMRECVFRNICTAFFRHNGDMKLRQFFPCGFYPVFNFPFKMS